MTRLRAFCLHLLASSCVAAIVAAVIVFVWYPDFYFHASGAGTLIRLLVGVDVVLGPLLTLMLYRPGKPGLVLDMSCVFLVQLAALIYGLHVIAAARPVYLVAAIDRLTVVTAGQVEEADLPTDPESPYRDIPWNGPRLAGLRLPQDAEDHNRVMFEEFAGKPAESRPRLYVDYQIEARLLVERGQPVAGLLQRPAEQSVPVQRWLERTGRAADSVLWVPLQGSKRDMVALIDRQQGTPLTAFDIAPW